MSKAPQNTEPLSKETRQKLQQAKSILLTIPAAERALACFTLSIMTVSDLTPRWTPPPAKPTTPDT